MLIDQKSHRTLVELYRLTLLTSAAEQFVAGERGIALSQLAWSGAGCVSPPAPPELRRWVAIRYRATGSQIQVGER